MLEGRAIVRVGHDSAVFGGCEDDAADDFEDKYLTTCRTTYTSASWQRLKLSLTDFPQSLSAPPAIQRQG